MFGEKLKELREDRHLLQRQMASQLDIDGAVYSKIERGERRAKREIIPQMAKILNVDEEELLTLWVADRISEVADSDKDVASNALSMVQQNYNK